MASPDFISDDDFGLLQKQGLVEDHNPDFLSDEDMNQIQTAHRMGAVKAGVEHLGNAAALGYAPQLVAGTSQAIDTAQRMLGMGPGGVDKKLEDQGFKVPQHTYLSDRDEEIARLKQQEQEHPYASTAGSVLGAIAGGGSLTPVLGGVTATGMGTRALQAARIAAIAGAVSNPGDTAGEIDPSQAKDRATNAALSAAMAVPLQVGGDLVTKGLKAGADTLSDYAKQKAFKALNPNLRQVINNQDEIKAIGGTLLDEGVVGKIPATYETLKNRASDAKDAAGQQIEKIVNDLASKENVPTLSRQEIADKMREQLLSDPSLQGVKGSNSRLLSLINEFAPGPTSEAVTTADALPLREARALKSNVGGEINWDRLPGADVPLPEQYQRALYGELKGGEEAIAQKLAESGQIPNADAFLNAKKTYGNLSTAEKIADKSAARNTANHFLGLKDTIAGGAGAGVGAYLGEQLGGHEGAKTGALIGSGVGGLGSKLARTFGPQVAAQLANGLSGVLTQSPMLTELVGKYPAIAPELLNALKINPAPNKNKDQSAAQRRLAILNQDDSK